MKHTSEIADDIQALVEIIKANGTDADVAIAWRVEAWLATYQPDEI